MSNLNAGAVFGAGLQARYRNAAREGRPPGRQAFFNRLTSLHILARNFIIYWYTWLRRPDHGAKLGTRVIPTKDGWISAESWEGAGIWSRYAD